MESCGLRQVDMIVSRLSFNNVDFSHKESGFLRLMSGLDGNAISNGRAEGFSVSTSSSSSITVLFCLECSARVSDEVCKKALDGIL